MNPINRAIAVLTRPQPTLSAAAGEPATTSGLVTGYAALLAALPALGMLLSVILFAGAALSYIIGSTVVMIFLTYLFRDLGLTLLVGLALGALAPNFGGRADKTGAMKLAVYAATPIWIAGFVFALLAGPLGGLAWLFVLAGFGFAGYILYLGAGPLLGVPQAQAPIVAGIVTVGWLVLYFIVEQIIARIFLSMMFGGAGYYGM